MKNNVDCEIYISGFISFFEKNPKDLKNLIGEMDKEKFFMQVRITVYQNFDKGEEITISSDKVDDLILNNKAYYAPIKNNGKDYYVALNAILKPFQESYSVDIFFFNFFM
jgi:hypothetical protein